MQTMNEIRTQRYRLKPTVGIDVQAIQVSHSNIRAVAQWATAHGGARAGLSYVDVGPVDQRHVHLGAVSVEDELTAHVGQWLALFAGEVFLVLDDGDLHRRFDRVAEPADIASVTEFAASDE